MKRTTALAALLAATVASGAIAQTATVGTTAGADTGNAAVSAEAGGKANFGQIVSDLKNGTENMTEWAAEIAALPEDADVEIVTLSELQGQGADNAQALDNILTEKATDLATVQMAVEGKTDLVAALEAEGFTPEKVVAVEVEGENEVTLIVDDRS